MTIIMKLMVISTNKPVSSKTSVVDRQSSSSCESEPNNKQE